MEIPKLDFRESLAWAGWAVFTLSSAVVFVPLVASTGLLSGNVVVDRFFFPWKLVWNTLRISTIAGVLCLTVALIMALLLTGIHGTLLGYVCRGMLLIGFMPTVLRSFGWVGIWQFIAYIVNDPLLSRGSFVKVTLALVHLYVPFATFLILQLVSKFDPAQVKAAMACGIRPWKIFLFVMMPQLARVLFGVLILLIVLYSGAIITPVILGSGHETMLVEEIYRIMNVEFDPHRASNIIMVLLGIIACGSFLIVWSTKKIGYEA